MPKAIESFLTQTYRSSLLLILSDGQDVRDVVPDDPRIQLIHLAETRNIGEKRNYGCERARGEVICHWDDDDWSAPARVADQVARLSEKCSVTGYHSMRFTDGTHWWLYQGTHDYALGTSLCYLRSWWQQHPFEARQVGEDNYFVAAARRAKQLVSVDAGELMHATIHSNNTSPRYLTEAWKRLQ
ncbi:MAG TPA: glycosyltransferase family A protein [Pyrinomonadaceae bacterium]|nr:glycosyltransferase family A protein [Pyrinomonadaceae bacterium]